MKFFFCCHIPFFFVVVLIFQFFPIVIRLAFFSSYCYITVVEYDRRKYICASKYLPIRYILVVEKIIFLHQNTFLYEVYFYRRKIISLHQNTFLYEVYFLS